MLVVVAALAFDVGIAGAGRRARLTCPAAGESAGTPVRTDPGVLANAQDEVFHRCRRSSRCRAACRSPRSRIDGGRNGGILAARILALSDPELRHRLGAPRAEMAQMARQADGKVSGR